MTTGNKRWSDLYVKVTWLLDGRKMRLNHAITYTDKNETEWTAPANFDINGANIPRIFWTIFGCPFVGRYRRASVIHDYYCHSKDRPHKDVHRMFYEAMLDSGVSRGKAKMIYRTIKWFGPKWKT